MEDILASIRRILSEDEANPEPAAEAPQPSVGTPPAAAPAGAAPPPPPDVLALDPSMLVEESPEPEESPAPPAPEPLPPLHAEQPPEPHATPAAPTEDHSQMPATPEPPPATAPYSPPEPLVAPEAAAAAASSVGSLLRTIGSRQGVGVTRGGPTIEELVREELRPVLKAWLDANLPPLVERLVRTEIERVVGRADI